METLAANQTGSVRREIRNGREYLVAPVSMIVPGVLAGSKGALYYPSDETPKNYKAWKSIPITNYHPTHLGNYVSASHAGVKEKQHIGFVDNPCIDKIRNNRLHGEGWFDVAHTKRINPQIIKNLKAGVPMELSTGLFTRNDPAPPGASFNGRSYDFIARDYRPDHLAVLVSQVGACSIKDGCGVLVNKALDGVAESALERADFVKLGPVAVREGGTNCLNCKYEKDDHCTYNDKADLRGLKVSGDSCCAFWDEEGTERPWKDTTSNQFGALQMSDTYDGLCKWEVLRNQGEVLWRITANEQPSDRISSSKACQILKDGTAQGHELTEDQRKMFGAACHGGTNNEAIGNYLRGESASLVEALQNVEAVVGVLANYDPEQGRDEKGRWSVGDTLTHTDRYGEKAKVEFRGHHNSAETGEKMARVIFRPEQGMPFEMSVKPHELSGGEAEKPAEEEYDLPGTATSSPELIAKARMEHKRKEDEYIERVQAAVKREQEDRPNRLGKPISKANGYPIHKDSKTDEYVLIDPDNSDTETNEIYRGMKLKRIKDVAKSLDPPTGNAMDIPEDWTGNAWSPEAREAAKRAKAAKTTSTDEAKGKILEHLKGGGAGDYNSVVGATGHKRDEVFRKGEHHVTKALTGLISEGKLKNVKEGGWGDPHFQHTDTTNNAWSDAAREAAAAGSAAHSVTGVGGQASSRANVATTAAIKTPTPDNHTAAAKAHSDASATHSQVASGLTAPSERMAHFTAAKAHSAAAREHSYAASGKTPPKPAMAGTPDWMKHNTTSNVWSDAARKAAVEARLAMSTAKEKGVGGEGSKRMPSHTPSHTKKALAASNKATKEGTATSHNEAAQSHHEAASHHREIEKSYAKMSSLPDWQKSMGKAHGDVAAAHEQAVHHHRQAAIDTVHNAAQDDEATLNEAYIAYNEKWNQGERDKLSEDSPEDFAGPHQSFPIKSQLDVEHAAKLIGHAEEPEAVKSKIKAIAKRKGLSLPESWKGGDTNNTSTVQNGANEMLNKEQTLEMYDELISNCGCQATKTSLLNTRAKLTANGPDMGDGGEKKTEGEAEDGFSDADPDGSEMQPNGQDGHSFDDVAGKNGGGNKGGTMQAGGKGVKSEYGAANTANAALEEWLAANNAPSVLREMVIANKQQVHNAKLSIARRLVANIGHKPTRIAAGNRYMRMSLEDLKLLSAGIPTSNRNVPSYGYSSNGYQDSTPNYNGAAGAYDNLSANSEGIAVDGDFVPPTMNYNDPEASSQYAGAMASPRLLKLLGKQ